MGAGGTVLGVGRGGDGDGVPLTTPGAGPVAHSVASCCGSSGRVSAGRGESPRGLVSGLLVGSTGTVTAGSGVADNVGTEVVTSEGPAGGGGW